MTQGLAVAAGLLFASAVPGAAEDAPDAMPDPAPDAIWSELTGPSIADEIRRAVPRRDLPVIELRMGAAPVGLAFEVNEGVHLGAAGKFDPERDEAVGLIALRLSL